MQNAFITLLAVREGKLNNWLSNQDLAKIKHVSQSLRALIVDTRAVWRSFFSEYINCSSLMKGNNLDTWFIGLLLAIYLTLKFTGISCVKCFEILLMMPLFRGESIILAGYRGEYLESSLFAVTPKCTFLHQ